MEKTQEILPGDPVRPTNRPSMRDVARTAGVSLASVSLVAAGRPGVSSEIRSRTLAAMTALGYVHRPRSRSPQTLTPSRQRYTLAIISEQLGGPLERDIFYAEILHGIQSEAQRQGHRVLLHLLETGASLLDDPLWGEIDGMILANGGDLTSEVIQLLLSTRVPAVLVDNYLVDLPLHCVVADNVTAGYLATRHLLRLGHRRIGFLDGSRKYRSLVDRHEGYLDALTEFDVPVDPTLIAAPLHGQRKGYRQMQSLLHLPVRPTAIVAISDKTALGAIEAIRAEGLTIPDDMALVSIDDVSESVHTTPPLTTVHIPRMEMGAEAVRRILSLLNTSSGEMLQPTKTVLYTHLVVRQSCGGSSISPM